MTCGEHVGFWVTLESGALTQLPILVIQSLKESPSALFFSNECIRDILMLLKHDNLHSFSAEKLNTPDCHLPPKECLMGFMENKHFHFSKFHFFAYFFLSSMACYVYVNLTGSKNKYTHETNNLQMLYVLHL